MNQSLGQFFNQITKTFSIKREVDLEGMGIHLVLTPLTSREEMMVLEACSSKDGAAFISELKRSSLAYSIKEINQFTFYDLDVTYPDPADGTKEINESKYIFLTRYIDEWPVAIRDALFDAFNDIQLELEDTIEKKTKFKRFGAVPKNIIKESLKEAGIPKGFRKIEESKEPEPENETERLNQQVEMEAEMVENHRTHEMGKAEERLNG